MSTLLHVHLSIDGEALAEIPFSSDRLQVGRLEENDVVVRDRAASRTHALLEREGDQVFVEDLGSQNGIWLGGERIEGRVPIGPGDRIRIGRHTLWVGRPGTEAPAPIAPMPETGGVQSSTDVEASTEVVSASACVVSAGAPDVDLFSIGDEDLVEAGSPLEAPADWSIDPADEELGEVADILDSGEPETELQVLEGDEAEPELEGDEAEPAASFPGLIVQRSGQLDRILAWEEDELCAGRGAECEIFLGAREVSRRHALFVRSGDRYEVRDLDSINGVFVNGDPVRQRVLCVGDVVQIETFELTFVLEPEPIGSEIQTGAEVLEPEVEHTDPLSKTIEGQVPLVLGDAARSESGNPAQLDEAIEMETAQVDADEKELELAPLSFEERASAPLVLQVELAPDKLPEPVRRALQEMECSDEAIEITLRVKTKSA